MMSETNVVQMKRKTGTLRRIFYCEDCGSRTFKVVQHKRPGEPWTELDIECSNCETTQADFTVEFEENGHDL